MFWRSVERTGEILHRCGKTLPGDGSPDWNSHLVQHDQEHAGPERGAMNPSRGPQVVADQQQQKRVAARLRQPEIPPRNVNGPADKGRIQKRNGGDEDEPLVRGRIEAVAEGEIILASPLHQSCDSTRMVGKNEATCRKRFPRLASILDGLRAIGSDLLILRSRGVM